MNHDKAGNRSYNEKEVGRLIQRATELYERSTGESERNLSLKEIEHIASELGLPREHLQTAALELEESQNPESSFRLWGGPFVVSETRVVGETMTEEQWEDIVLELRRFTGHNGKISELGRTRQWMHFVGEGENGINFSKTQVTLRPGKGKTSIQIRKNFKGISLWYPLVFVSGVALSLVALNSYPDPVTLALSGAGITGSFLAVRTLIRSSAKRHQVRLRRLADRLNETLSVTAPSLAETEPVPELIELPEDEESTVERIDTGRVSTGSKPSSGV
jgi:hypothetical protein